MALLTTFFGANWVAILSALGMVGAGIYTFLTKKASDTKVAQAGLKVAEAQAVAAQAQTQTAETRDVVAQANASAAQAGAQAVKERNDVEADTAAKSDRAVRDELRAWVQPSADSNVGASTATGAGANPDS